MDLREMIKRHEGLILSMYLCPTGHMTIGYGWNLDAHKLPPDIESTLRVSGFITLEMAERLLTIAIDAATRDCQEIYAGFLTFSEARRFALIDFVYNVGSTVALKFRKMIEAIEAGDWDKAAREMKDSLWFKQVGSRGPELVGMVKDG